MSHENVDLVAEMLRRFNEGELRSVFDLIDPDVTWQDPRVIPGGGVHRGHEGVRRWFARWLAAWEEFASEPQKFVDAGDQVIVIERMRGRGRQSGIVVDQTVVSSYAIRGGKVAERIDYTDEAEALRAVGLGQPGK